MVKPIIFPEGCNDQKRLETKENIFDVFFIFYNFFIIEILLGKQLIKLC